ncbi:MAG: MFS transporter [Streptosporangiales bacterium]|nr:MFS transporter [Streptosporangiales bacterium]
MTTSPRGIENVPGEIDEATRPRLRRMQWLVLLVTMFCYLFFYTGRQTFGFAIPGIEAELGLSKTTLGWVSTALLWAYAVGQAINGNLSDKFGGRKIMSLGAVVSTVLNWIMSFATGLGSIATTWGTNGYFQAMGWSAGSRVISNWWPRRERGKTYGFYVLAAGTGSVVAFATSVVVLDVWELDWRWIFRIPVLLMLLGAVTFFVIARNYPAERGLPSPVAMEEATDDPTSGGVKPSSKERYLAVLRLPKIWVTGVSIGFQNAARYGLLVWVPVHFLGTNWEESASGGVNPLWISVALPIGMAVGALVNGQLSDRLFGSRRSQPIMLFMGLGAVASLSMYLVPTSSTLLAIVLLFLTGFFVYGPQASFWALCPDLAGAARAGTATGVVNFFAYLFAGFGEPLAGYIIDTSGQTSYVFLLVAVCCAASAALAALIRR